VVAEKYGNLFEMYEKITGENPYVMPMKIYPAVHYTMGGLWVDYNLQTNIPGLFAAGEANFSDHGANRLGASALMQGLADGYFVEYCGMARNAEGLTKGRQLIRELRAEFYQDVFVPGSSSEYNPELEKALRVADFLELGELMMLDALDRQESCGGHFREEYQTEDGEALRRDDEFAYVSAWEWDDNDPILHKEELIFENVELKTRSYK